MSVGVRLCILYFCLEELKAYRYLAWEKKGESGRLDGFTTKNVVPSRSPSWVRGFLEKEGTNGVNYSWPVSKRPNNAGLNH